MPFTRGISTLGCPEMNLDEVAALAGRFGLGAAELRAIEGSLDVPSVLERRYGNPEALAAARPDPAVRIISLDTSFHLVGSDEAERSALLRFVPWAEALGAPYLRVFDAGKPGHAFSAERAAQTLAWWRTLRRDKAWRVDLIVETHDALLTARAIRDFVTLDPEALILWDTHHTWRRGGENPVDTWNAIRSHVRHVHVKDSVSLPSPKHPYTYVLPGKGEFPMGPLLSCLRTGGYAGTVCLEWEKLWEPDLPSLEEALLNARHARWW